MVKIAKPDSESEDEGYDVRVSSLVAKEDAFWKWNKCFEKPALKNVALQKRV